MAVLVCPLCGKPSVLPEDHTGVKAKCPKCGKMVPVVAKGKSSSPGRKKKRTKRKKKLAAARRKRIRIAAAVLVSLAILLVFNASKSTPPIVEFNDDELDKMILAVGIIALENRGRTKQEAALYVETRIQEHKVANKTAKSSFRSGGSSSSKLTLKSTATDVDDLGKSELSQAVEEVADREILIKEFERLLADYRQANNLVQ